MKGKRFTDEQIIGILKEVDAGATTKDLCRRHGIEERHHVRASGVAVRAFDICLTYIFGRRIL